MGQILGIIGAVAGLGAALWALSQKGGESFALMLGVGAVSSLASVLAVEVAKQAVWVLVDLARNARAIRRELSERSQNS